MDPLLLEYFLSPWVVGLFGLVVGSFLNVVIHRTPLIMDNEWKLEHAELLGLPKPEVAHLSLSRPSSHCPSCGHEISWHENVPVLSYLRLGGRCSACKVGISIRYPAVEVITGMLFGMVAWRLGPVPVVLLWCGFMAVLVALAGIDWDTTLLPDSMTLPLLWSGLLASAFGWTVPLQQALWGAVAGYLSLWTLYWLYKWLTGKDGMGHGDFKLLAALGAWLGLPMLLPVLLGASIIGSIVGLFMQFKGLLRDGIHVPFGPFLAGSGAAVMLTGQQRVLGWMGWA